MSAVDIGAAFEVRLAAMVGAIATAYENDTYEPTEGTPYQRVFLIPTDTVNPTFGDNQAREEGIFHVTLCYPEKKGSGAALTQAELVRGQFTRGLTLTSGTVSARVKNTPYIAPARYEDGLYLLDISIPYFAYI